MSELAPASLLAGSWVNMIFYGTEIVLASFYFLNSKPSPFFRWSLLVALCIDSVCTGVICYNVYLNVIMDPQDMNSEHQPWTLPVTILCTYHAALVEQVFFARRYWQITHNKLVTVFISSLVVIHMAFAWILAMSLVATPLVTTFGLNLTIIAATLCAATDLSIACIMFLTMRSIQTTYEATQGLLRRISIQSVACGFTTSIFTILMLSLLVTHYLNPFTVVFDVLGRLYTLTILVNYIMLRRPLASMRTLSEAYSASTGAARQPRSLVFNPTNTPRTFTVPVELSTINGTRSAQNFEEHSKVDHNLEEESSSGPALSQRQQQSSAECSSNS